MSAKMDEEFINNLISQLSQDFVLKKYEIKSSEEFYAIIQGKLEIKSDYDETCKSWITDFSRITKTNWISKKRFGNPRRYTFRKIFACQHSQINKIQEQKKSYCRERNRKCKASIDIKFKKFNRNTIRNDALLKQGKNVLITIDFSHSHKINVAEALSYLRIAPETSQLFINYFQNNMTPASARLYHELHVLNSRTINNAIETLANSQLNPTKRQINHLYAKWREGEFGSRQEESVIKILKSKKDIYESKGIIIIIKENPMIIVIITAVMRRTFLEDFSNNMVFIDSSGSCDQTNTTVTFVFTSYKIGAIPLACILHTSQSEANYTMVFSAVKEAFQITGKELNPNIIMTDDSSAERNALRAVFPNARLILCIFHVCQALWRWLWQTQHQVKKEDCKEVMNMFRYVLYASTLQEAEEFYLSLRSSKKVQDNNYLLNHFEKLWERRFEWCLSYRDDVLTRGHNTNNYAEASIRIFKDLVLQRCKVFNACALVEFIANTFESYYQRRLLECANSRNTAMQINYRQFCEKTRKLDTTRIYKVDENTYYVPSQADNNLLYTVHVDLGVCTCPQGRSGRFCKHLCAIELNFGNIFKNSPILSQSERVKLAYLAMGETIENEFFTGMDVSETNPESQLQIIHTDVTMNNSINCFEDEPLQDIFQEEINSSTLQDVSNEVKTEFSKVVDLLNKSSSETTALIRIKNILQNINTPNQALSFFQEKIQASRLRKIKVQPTAISRRAQRGLSKTKNPIQSGRPSNEEKKKKKKAKKPHNLKLSIEENRPNAKLH